MIITSLKQPVLLFLGLSLVGCASSSKSIKLSTQSTLNSIKVKKNYLDLKKDYSVTKKVNYGPEPDQLQISYEQAKENINYDAPNRKIEFSATVWDLPLIQSYLASPQHRGVGASLAEDIRKNLMNDYKTGTQIMLSVDSYVKSYFSWSDWSIWLEDAKGEQYYPLRSQGTSEVEKVEAKKKTVWGRETLSPSYEIYHSYGTLYFEKLDLAALSPLKLVLADGQSARRVDIDMSVKGEMSQDDDVAPVSPPAPKPPEVSSIPEIDEEEQKRLYFTQATNHYKNGDYHEAIADWVKVLEIDPEHELSSLKIKKARAAIEKQDKEAVVYTEIQRKKQMKIHFLMASEYYKAGEYEEAIEEWNEVLELDPNHSLSKQKIEKAKKRLGL